MKEKHGKLKDEHVLHRKNGINSGAGKLFVSYYSVIPTTGAGGVASAFFGFPPLGAVGVGLGFVEARFLAGGITVQICQFKLVKGLILK